MPILSGGLYVPPDLDGSESAQTPVWTEDFGSITASWIDPDGLEWPLSDTSDASRWFTMSGPAGWGATPVELVTDPLPRGGEQVRYIRSQPRRIQWPLYIGSQDSHEDFVSNYRRILRAFTKTSQRAKPGWLRIARPNGRFRQIACYYEQGMEGEAGENHRFAKPVITLYCPDGYWSSDRPVSAYRQFAASPGGSSGGGGSGGGGGGTSTAATFFSPYMSVLSSKIVSAGGGDSSSTGDSGGGETGSATGTGTIISNAGDVPAWPVWTIKGPMTRMVAENRTVGTRWSLRYNLLTDQIITITTNRPTVRGPGNANLTGSVDWFDPLGCELWPLTNGDNEIAFLVEGANSGTRVDLNFTPRYETA